MEIAAAKGRVGEAATKATAIAHQVHGAIGFTHEHDLHVWTMRLQALRVELGGVTGHCRALSATRWGISS